MKSREYLVSRDDIYVGEVIRTDSISRNIGNGNFSETKKRKLEPSIWQSYRSMLFVPNEKNLSNDLLYATPSYPILNVTDDNFCLCLEGKNIVVNDAYNLAEFLEYFGYQKDLTYEDIMRIRNDFFTGRFGMDHSKLFGMEEFVPNSFVAKEKGVLVLDEQKRYELYKKSLNLGSERQFGSIEDGIFSRELMSVLDERGRSNYGAFLGDIFHPNVEEGPIRKLVV